MHIVNMEQGTVEWFLARLGIPTASGFSRVITTSGKRSASFDDYAIELAGEKLVGTFIEGFKSKDMKRGNIVEPQARGFYEFLKDTVVEQVGIVYADEKKEYACSPDGLLYKRTKGLEIKCPLIKTHIKYIMEDKLPDVYYQQVQGSMMVTGLRKWDFMSYYPDVKPFIKTIDADLDFQHELKVLIYSLNEMVLDIHSDLRISNDMGGF